MDQASHHLWFERALLPTGWAERVRIGVSDGRMASVEFGVEPNPDDERGRVALPGLANVHSHGFQRGMAGLSERRGRPDDDFWSWREVMYRFLDRLDPDDVAAITAQAYLEMLESGFTRVGEFHYLHNDVDGRRYADPAAMAGAVVRAAEETGIGLTLLPVFYAHADFGGEPPNHGQRRFVSDVDGFAALVEASRAKLSGDMNLGIAPHSLRAVTPDELAAILPLGDGGPVHIHAAEQLREVDACLAWSGARPVEWLLDHADVGPRWCLIHATHMTNAEIERLAASGAVAGLCPITEANLGDGVFPAERFLMSGGRFGVGTDSNILVDAPGELRAIEYGQRLTLRRRAVLASDAVPSVGERLFQAAVVGGAQALGVAGGLAVGAPADVVELDPGHPALAGTASSTILDAWIFAARHGAVRTVWRAGTRVVECGRHRAAERVAARICATFEKIRR